MQAIFINKAPCKIEYSSEGLQLAIEPNQSITLNSEYANLQFSLAPMLKTSVNNDKVLETGYYQFIVKADYSVTLNSDIVEIFLTLHSADGADEDAYTFISAFSPDITVNEVKYKTVEDEVTEEIKRKSRGSKRVEGALNFFLGGPLAMLLFYIVIAAVLIYFIGISTALVILIPLAIICIAGVIAAFHFGGKLGGILSHAITKEPQNGVHFKGYQSYFNSEYVTYRIQEYFKNH